MSVHWGGRGFGHVSRNSNPLVTVDLTAGTLPASVTFSRADASTIGTYVGSDGLVHTVAANGDARFTYDQSANPQGLMIEDAATNLILRSQDFNTTWALDSTTSTTGVTAPDGSSTGCTIAATATAIVDAKQNFAVSANTQYTVSIYFKAGTSAKFYIQLNNNGNGTGGAIAQYYDAATGAAGTLSALVSGFTGVSVAAPVAVANGFYRVSVTLTTPASATSLSAFFAPCDADNSRNVTSGKTVVLWQAQCILGALPGSVIKTVGSTVTRALEAATIAFTGSRSLATITYPGGIATVNNPTSPLNIGSSSGGAWVGSSVQRVVIQ